MNVSKGKGERKMITKVTMKFERRNFFGVIDEVRESREWDIERKHVLKAINAVVDDSMGFCPCAHFDVDDGLDCGGSHYAIWQDNEDRGTSTVTMRCWIRKNSSDTYKRTLKQVKAESLKW